MNGYVRTDLAAEARDLWREGAGETAALPGVTARSEKRRGFDVDVVEILDGQGEKELCKPMGRYSTLRLDATAGRGGENFHTACLALSELLREALSLEMDSTVLVVGLGNGDITPDAVGPAAADGVLVTRHLKEALPEDFRPFRSVAVVRSGVLGTTGVESARLIAAVAALVKPDRVIAVDALAARDAGKLCRTVQVSDAGIVPGSGVGNAREALNQALLGVPVVAVGVPTVVDAATLCRDLTGKELEGDEGKRMIVTPRDIDRRVADAARLISRAVNMALHETLSPEELDSLTP